MLYQDNYNYIILVFLVSDTTHIITFCLNFLIHPRNFVLSRFDIPHVIVYSYFLTSLTFLCIPNFLCHSHKYVSLITHLIIRKHHQRDY